MAPIGSFFNQLREVLASQSSFQRAMALLVVVAVPLGLWYASHRGGGSYAPLFTSMEDKDAVAVAAYLKASNARHRIEGDGTIMVPRSERAALRMDLAQANPPMGGGTGFEFFAKTPIGMTDRVQEINYQRALQGELARSIATLSTVERANVILALPKASAFLRKDIEKPSASVVLTLKPGADLSPAAVDGIVVLVSTAVSGLEPENVSLTDSRTGVRLNSGRLSPAGMNADGNIAFQTGYEQDLEAAIESMLERRVGAGNVVARVRAEFDFRQVSTVERKFDDDAKALESRTVQAENIGGDVSPRRQPGWGIALPGMNSGDYIRRFDNGKSSGNIQFTEQYKVSQIEKTIQEPSARLRALTCAVMIDSAALEKAGVADKSAAEGVQARSQREIDKDLASLTGLVNNAVGSPAHRDDVMFSVTVESMPFARSPEPAEAAPLADPERQEFIRLAVVWGVTGLLGILAVFFIARPLTQALSAALAPRPALGPSAAGESPGLEDAEEALRIPQGDRGRRMLQRAESEAADRRIEEILQKDPAKAAAMIRKWLEEN